MESICKNTPIHGKSNFKIFKKAPVPLPKNSAGIKFGKLHMATCQ